MGSSRLFEKVAIVGVGLIGGSLGLSISRKSLAGEILGIGRSRVALEMARECGAVDDISLSYDPLPGCDLVIVATPVGSTLDILKDISPHLSPGTLVTDVGSTKFEITGGSGELLPGNTVFIGGHPMAGSEKEGIMGADPFLFENALYVLTPTAGTPPHQLDRMVRLVEGMGARPIIMDPLEHDLSVAAVSHLPHLAAYVLVDELARRADRDIFFRHAASGFRDFT
ncbi:MAG: prephenate dehydrogenase/arogenate dehydrogenase family protein, partial [Firmicutes bacterium]|nr:prephenate dehydrogenase/arogenate dehydrogenase family protein [Bacillota bacterium]